MISRAWFYAGGASLAVIGLAWSIGYATAQYRGLVADADARGHARGRAEAVAEQSVEIERLRAEADNAAAREAKARAEALAREADIRRDYETRHAEALRRAREAAGGDCLRRPVPDGLRIGPAAGVRGPGGASADPPGAARGARDAI